MFAVGVAAQEVVVHDAGGHLLLHVGELGFEGCDGALGVVDLLLRLLQVAVELLAFGEGEFAVLGRGGGRRGSGGGRGLVQLFVLAEAGYLLGCHEIGYAPDVFFHAPVCELEHLIRQPGEEVAVVGDDDDCALEAAQGFLEDVLGAHIEVVGRLVEQEDVVGFEQEAHHSEARAFAAGEDAHLLVHVVAGEEERPEDVPKLFADFAYCHAVDGVEDGEFRVEQVCLVLGEVADVDVVPDAHFAGEGDFAHNHLDQRGFAFAVFADEGDFLAAAHLEVDALEDDVAAICLAEVAPGDGDVPGADGGLEADGDACLVLLLDLDAFELFELFDTGLHLDGLGRLVAEAFDEVFGVLDLLLLVLVGAHLLLYALLAELLEAGVGDFVVVDFAERDFDGARGDIVEEGAVVGHEDDCPGVCLEEGFEPGDGFDVEVVRRLVEEEDIGTREENLGKLDAHAPAAAEFAALAAEVFRAEAQSLEDDFGLFLHVAFAAHGEELRALVDFVEELEVVRRVVVRAGGKLFAEAGSLVAEGEEVGKGFLRLLAHGVAVGVDFGLREVADAEPGGHGDAALGGLLEPCQHLEGGGLAGAVAPGEPDAVFLVNQEGYAVEQVPSPEYDAYVVH